MSKRINRNRNRKNRKKNNVNQNVNKSLKSNDLEKEEKEIEEKNKIDENSDINETNEMNDILVYESQTNEDEYKEDNNELENRINEILIDEQINSDYDDEKLTDDVVEKSEEEKELEEKVNEVFNENEDDNSVKTDEEVTKKVRNGEVETKKKSKKKTLIIISSLCIILLIVAFLISFAFVNKFNTNVYNNVYLLNENMSGKTQEQIAEFLNLKAEELKPQEIIKELTDKALKRYEEKETEFGEKEIRELERVVLLKIVDEKWMEHIDNMDELKNGIGLRAYGQKDPVVQYRIEGTDMFDEMNANIKLDVVKILSNVEKVGNVVRTETAKITGQGLKAPAINLVDGKLSQNEGGIKKTIVNEGPKIGRNDPCPCGSGKKYKNCCGKNA